MMPAFKRKPAENQPDMKPVEIKVLGAFFNEKTGTWVTDELQAKKNIEVMNEHTLEKEKAMMAKLEAGLAKKLISLDAVKKEIRMILTDHQQLLTSQGFQTEELLQKFPGID